MIFEQIYGALSVHMDEMMAVNVACCCGELSALLGLKAICGGEQWEWWENNDKKSVLELDLKILKVCKSRLSFSSGGEGNKINTPPRQALQIKYAKYGGGEEIAMQWSPMSSLHIGQNHPDQNSKHSGLCCSNNMYCWFWWIWKGRRVQGSEREGSAEGHSQANPRGVSLPRPRLTISLRCSAEALLRWGAVCDWHPCGAVLLSPTSLCRLEHAGGQHPERGDGWVGQVH